MKKEVREKLTEAKKGLMDVLATMYTGGSFVTKRINAAIEAMDDALEGQVKFPRKK